MALSSGSHAICSTFWVTRIEAGFVESAGFLNELKIILAKDKVDVHHVFPQAWCKKQRVEPKVFDSIVNKTPLSKKSNILIGGDAPSVYLKRIECKHGLSPERLDAILRTHMIEPSFLRRDDFQGFFDARLEALSKVISMALGKAVVASHGSNEPEIEVEVEEDDNDPDKISADALDELAPV